MARPKRKTILNAALKALLAGAETSAAITQTIQGLGGVGKTRLAVEFGWWAVHNKNIALYFS